MAQPPREMAVAETVSDLALMPGATAASARPLTAVLGDVFALTKPRLSSMVLFTAAGGLYLAPGSIGWWKALAMLAMTYLAVGSANALNCWIERDGDRLMKRTRPRPLPSGRLDPRVALWFGIVAGTVSVPVLSLLVNPLTGLLAFIAIASYALWYTPMKRRSPWAVLVGTLPGAIPPLMGWTAVTNRIDAAGLALFGVLFFWQIPHFLAIALYLREDYRRAGIRALPLTHGDTVTLVWMAVATVGLVAVTLALWPLGLVSAWAAVLGTALGIALLGWSLTGFRSGAGPRWARKFMLATVTYLSVLFVVLGLGAA